MEFFKYRLGPKVKAPMVAVAIAGLALIGTTDSAHAYKNVRDSITLYSGPNSETASKKDITDGVEIEELLIVSRDMVKVRTSKGVGWIKNSQYQNLAQPEQDRSLVIQRATELRTRGGMSGAVSSQLGQGTVIREILFKGNHWYKVATDKGTGWVRKSVVENHTTAKLEAVTCTDCETPKPPPPISTPQLKPLIDIAEKLPQPPAKPVKKPKPKPVATKPEVVKEEPPRKPAGNNGLISPIKGQCRVGRRGFGAQKHPISGGVRMHWGHDIQASSGTTLVAPAEGKVVFAGRMGGYGNVVEVQFGSRKVRYAHMRNITTRVGASVKQGQPVGAVGSTGHSTGPHLHLEAFEGGRRVNPMGMFKGVSLCGG